MWATLASPTCGPRGVRIKDEVSDVLRVSVWCQHGQISSGGLVGFDGFEEGFEVPSAKTLVVVSLDDLQEHRGPVLDGFGEDLKQVSIVVIVHQDAQALVRNGERKQDRKRLLPVSK